VEAYLRIFCCFQSIPVRYKQRLAHEVSGSRIAVDIVV